jgi:hypothetical protein
MARPFTAEAELWFSRRVVCRDFEEVLMDRLKDYAYPAAAAGSLLLIAYVLAEPLVARAGVSAVTLLKPQNAAFASR